MERRQQLLAWIEETQRLQRRLTVALAALFVASLALLAWHRFAGTMATIAVLGTGVVSSWITAAHNDTHRTKLAELDARDPRPRS